MTGGARTERGAFQVSGRLVLFALVGFFAVVSAVNAVMITAAVRTFGGVETENAYQAGLAFNRDIAAANAQAARDWHVDISRPTPGRAEFVVTVRDAAGRPVPGLALDGALVHPTDRRHDKALSVEPAGAGAFRARAEAAAGQWDLTIELHDDSRTLFRSRSRVVLR